MYLFTSKHYSSLSHTIITIINNFYYLPLSIITTQQHLSSWVLTIYHCYHSLLLPIPTHYYDLPLSPRTTMAHRTVFLLLILIFSYSAKYTFNSSKTVYPSRVRLPLHSCHNDVLRWYYKEHLTIFLRCFLKERHSYYTYHLMF
jgi:hypothetical protein